MNAEDLRYYLTSLGETRRIMADIITILRTQEQTISDIVNHPRYLLSSPPRRRRTSPNYFRTSIPRFMSRNISPPRVRRNLAQSPLPRPNRRPPTFPIPSPPPPPPATAASIPIPPAPISSNIDIVNEPADGPSNSSTPRNIRNRLFGTSITASTGGSGLSPNRNTAAPEANIAAEATPIANRIADLLGVALFNEIAGSLSPVTVIPTDRQIREATELIQYSSLFDPASNQEPQYSRCPISHEEFTPNSRVYRICHCGHYFEPQSLLTWFRTSVRCPVCRYDIRTHVHSAASHSVEEEDIEEEEVLEDIDEEEEEIIEETGNIPPASSISDFISNVQVDQQRNPIGRNRRRVYSYQFDVRPFVTRNRRDPSGNNL